MVVVVGLAVVGGDSMVGIRSNMVTVVVVVGIRLSSMDMEVEVGIMVCRLRNMVGWARVEGWLWELEVDCWEGRCWRIVWAGITEGTVGMMGVGMVGTMEEGMVVAMEEGSEGMMGEGTPVAVMGEGTLVVEMVVVAIRLISDKMKA